jgi:nitrilase
MNNGDTKYIAAAVQTAPVFLNKDETIGKVTSLIEEASAEGASLIVFPEATVPGYPYWPKDLGTIEGRKLIIDAYTELHANSLEIPGEDTDKLAEAAKKAGAYVVIGVNEKEGGTLYNTILYIDRSGEILGKHRKLMSIDSEKCIWANGGAEDLRVFDTEIGNLGGFFCYEHHLTLAKYAMYTKGEQIHAGLWAGHGFVKPTMDFASKQYAFEGQVFVIVSSGYINESMIPDSFPLKKNTLWDFPGGSGIISPRGEYIAGPVYDHEDIVYAEIDTNLILRAKVAIDSTGHFSRPDILELKIHENEESQLSQNKLDKLEESITALEAKIKSLTELLEN